jgi:Tol biopolymer transport system component
VHVSVSRLSRVVFACVLSSVVVTACSSARVVRSETPTRSSPPRASTDTDACAVNEIRYLTDGGGQSWSPAGDLFAYDQPDAAGISQLHIMRPDGSDDQCLTCTATSGAPRMDRHKFKPTWRSTGDFIALQGEMDSHPLSWLRDNKSLELFANGLWSNLYATTLDGQRWYRLTDYDGQGEDGMLFPYFSPDGGRLFWSRLLERATLGVGPRPFGRWRLQLADFVVDGAGVPSLQNLRDITPDGATFVEASGFSPDGSTVLFTGDMENTHGWGMDIWALDLTTNALTNLTKGPHWEEHASYAPNGRLISFMSSSPYPTVRLQTELFLMNADGSDKRQITRFNVDGAPEKTAEKSMPVHNSWSPDGTRLAITLQYGGSSYPKRQLYMLTFAGACGA